MPEMRKYIVTEMVTTTVPVRREEVRLEREPITGAESAPVPDGGWSDEPLDLVLHEERLVIEKRVVATERVRLKKETITEEHTVSEAVRKEQIEASVGGRWLNWRRKRPDRIAKDPKRTH